MAPKHPGSADNHGVAMNTCLGPHRISGITQESHQPALKTRRLPGFLGSELEPPPTEFRTGATPLRLRSRWSRAIEGKGGA